MQIAAGRRADATAQGFGRALRALIAAVGLGLSAAACTTTGQPGVAAAIPRGPTVAFESIDGPPESIFQKLVQNLSDEADARQLAVVSREGQAQYRVRGYVSAQSQGKRSTVAWVWDIYDAEQRRAFRITGEEQASAAGQGTWAVADDQVLRRIARTGMERLATFLASPPAQPEAAPPAERGPALTVAAADIGAPIATAESPAGPPRRPTGPGLASERHGELAYLLPNR